MLPLSHCAYHAEGPFAADFQKSPAVIAYSGILLLKRTNVIHKKNSENPFKTCSVRTIDALLKFLETSRRHAKKGLV